MEGGREREREEDGVLNSRRWEGETRTGYKKKKKIK